VTVSGPMAWQLLQAAGFDAALAPIAMKHMTLREVTYGGLAMRVLRASFCGELGYEINLPALHTQALLERLWEVGREHGVVPYGIEALMIMRTEKGFLHVGGDTDGTTLPGDVGLDRGIAGKAANFVGRRSLLRPAARDPDRMQLVGLLPRDRRTRLPVGAHRGRAQAAGSDRRVRDLEPPQPGAGPPGGAGHAGARAVAHRRHAQGLAPGQRHRGRGGENAVLRSVRGACEWHRLTAQPLRRLSHAEFAGLAALWPKSSQEMALQVVEPMQVLSLRHLPGGGTSVLSTVLAGTHCRCRGRATAAASSLG
jgi:hypothetical protein